MKHTIKYPKHYVRAAFDADSIDWSQFVGYPGEDIDETQVGDKFSYNVPKEDPADWSIDFPDFFDAIYEAVRDLGLEVEDEEEDLGENHYIYTLSNGCTINTYDLETDILYALADGDISSDGQLKYIANWISDACK